MEKTLQFRPLHLVERMTEELGVSIAYAYDDLVFMEHGTVLLQFDDSASEAIDLFISSEVHPEDAQKLTDEWLQVALMHDIRLTPKGQFSIDQIPGTEEISVRFD